MMVESVPTKRETVDILGIQIDCLTMSETLKEIEKFLKSNKPHMIVTADSSGLFNQIQDKQLSKIMKSADMVTPDSIGVIWAAKKFGKPITERVNGVELVDHICELSAIAGYKLFFLGAAPGIAEQAADRLRLKHPGCNIVGTRNGYFPCADDDLIAQEIATFEPDVLFVAMGIPRQEKIYLQYSINY